ncbi:MAG: hypothetical protein EOO08_13085 [Chitinophagaceae bacterium]|nr:MAG: hypothetical protein EOO08_13085 [Chitinophagaceae bacterium]
MAKLKRATAVPNNGSVVIYYYHQGAMRYPTGVTISKLKTKSGRFVEWDERANMIRTTVKDYEVKRQKISSLLENANRILIDHFQQGEVLSAKDLQKQLSQGESAVASRRTSKVIDLYEEFYQRKKAMFTARGTLPSLKDYTSVKNMLTDYQASLGTDIKVRDVDGNRRFLENLVNWLRGDLPKYIGDHKLTTQGTMVDGTIKKRFDILIQFWSDLHDDGKVGPNEFIRKFKREYIKPVPQKKVTLTVEELFKLYDFKFEEDHLTRIRDLFVFACFTGLRWTDLMEFDPDFIEEAEDRSGLIYRRRASKTTKSSGKEFEIPLCQTALEILQRYGGSLKPLRMTNPAANRAIKEALKKSNLFTRTSGIRDKRTNEYKRRFEAVTMHKGRDTFISNLVTTTPLNELMRYTAHTKLTTLQKYLDMQRPIQTTYVAQAFTRKSEQ